MLRFRPAMVTKYLYYALWILPACAQVCLAVVMLRRRLASRLPIFFAYTVFQLVTFAVEFSVYQLSYKLYFVAYWAAAAISALLGFAVIVEVFREVFQPFTGLKNFGSVLFRWAAAVLVMAALLMAATGVQLTHDRLLALILTLGRSTRVMQCGLVLLLLLCSEHLGLSWRNYVFGISLGFGIVAAMDLIAITYVATYGETAARFFNLTKMSAYLVAVFVWTGYLSKPEPERLPASRLGAAEDWEFAIATANGGGQDSFLPQIESTVERVFNKKSNGGHSAADDKPKHADQ